MVEATDFWECDHVTFGDSLHASRGRRVFLEREMCPRVMIVGEIGSQDMPQMPFTEYDHVVQTLAVKGSDQPLHIRVGVRRRLHRRRLMRDKRSASRIPFIRCMGVSSDGSTAGRRGVRIASISTTMPGSLPGCRCGGPMSSPLIPPR
jgi:hypothetical protein